MEVQQTIILPLLCGCGTLSLTVREEHRLNMSENRVLRKTFWSKKEEVMEVEKSA
jgi:hypothetical protein